MEKEGKYIYCIINTKQERNFGAIGIGARGDEVLTIGYNDLSMVVSSHPFGKFTISPENMLAHERVIEEVMKEFDEVLPVRFGTIASSADEIRNLLDRGYRKFKGALRDMEHKVELGVKGTWKDMDVIFKEIVKENKKIKELKKIIQNEADKENIQLKTEVGKMVEAALAKKKENEAQDIADIFKKISVEYKLNKTITEDMFMNGAFLVDKGREKEFDNIMDELSKKYEDRIKFNYAGPLPVFNFVNITIYPEEWEK